MNSVTDGVLLSDADLFALSGLTTDGDVILDEEYDEYSQLPEVLQGTFTREQYLWLSDGEKAGLMQAMTEPEAI
jgi:hypothetical protein